MSIQDTIGPEKMEEILVSHLKENKIFREGPQPWTIRRSSLGGRGMFATRNIEQNELIFIDAPLIIGPRSVGKHLQMCVCCYKNECPLFPCDRGCGLPVCSNQCENSPKHVNYECEYLRSLVPTCGTDWSLDLLVAVIPIRALFMTEQQRKCLAALQYDETLNVDHEVGLLKKNVANSPSKKDMELMKRVCEVFNTNSFETVCVHDKDHFVSLRGLYPMGSLQNHCCIPNTRHHFDGDYRLYVSAALPISAGEEITMSYTSLFWDTTLRRQFLSMTKHFACICIAAVVEEILYKTSRQILRFMQKELSVLVPWCNYLIIDVKFRIISYFGRSDGLEWKDLSDNELDMKANYCNDLLSMLDVLNCGDCKKRGLILYELYCTNLEKMKRLKQQVNIEMVDENQNLLKKAMVILQNDIVTVTTFKHDQKYFEQLITV
ncbi:Protein msta, isoform A [Eufriesea mexicana]|uniref:Protein msta, isoform A n=1 Tax=Eufriesea mexicana TaxID=516756 RepID=A0A310SPA9_9HYME|nr:Protein msta, isoform A [Eufriesea mexicana]